MVDEFRTKLLALAVELWREADELDNEGAPGDGPKVLGYIEGKADALRSAELRLRAILGEAVYLGPTTGPAAGQQ